VRLPVAQRVCHLHPEAAPSAVAAPARSAPRQRDGAASPRVSVATTNAPDGAREWVLTLGWSGSAVRELLRWYADSAHADLAGTARAPLRFTPSLAKEHREQLHTEAKRARHLRVETIGNMVIEEVLPELNIGTRLGFEMDALDLYGQIDARKNSLMVW
jgi:hypothetical protein